MLQPAPRYKWPAIAGHGGPQNAGLLPAARANNMCQRLGAAGAAEGHGGRECSDAMPFDAWIECDIHILAETQRRPHHRPKYRHTGKNAIKVVFPFMATK